MNGLIPKRWQGLWEIIAIVTLGCIVMLSTPVKTLADSATVQPPTGTVSAGDTLIVNVGRGDGRGSTANSGPAD
jgi:hypothetical protein